MRVIILIFLVIIISCNQINNKNLYPQQIGSKKINSVVQGDSAVKEINTLHHLTVATENNLIVRYGQNSEDILYISKFENSSSAIESFDTMLSKMSSNKRSPFTYLVPMKKYNNKSYMTIGLGSVHYIYQSGDFVLWLSTKQKFYNELPKDLIEIYPAKIY